MKIAIISVTDQGDILANQIGISYEVELYSKNKTPGFDINSISKLCMESYSAVI